MNKSHLFLLTLLLSLLLSCHPPAEPFEVDSPASPDPAPTSTPTTTITAPPTPTFTPEIEITATATPAPAQNKRGIHLLLDDGRNVWPTELWAPHLQVARQAVGPWGYVTELIREDDLDVGRWQQFFDLCAEYELMPILRLATTFDLERQWWRAPEPDADGGYHSIAERYAVFVSALEWPTVEHYIIIGNEPNHGNEWSGRPDPAAYARFLVEVSVAIRATDSRARILNAGLDPYSPHTGSFPFMDGMHYMDAETFMDEMIAAVPEVFTQLDAWCSHAYPQGPFSQPPWQQTYGRDLINDAVNPQHREPPEEIRNRGINGYEWELFKLATYGMRPLPVMITETGWRHAETTNPLAGDTGLGLPDAVTVARYLDLAMYGNHGRYPELPSAGWTPWQDDPRVIAVTPFALNGTPYEWGHTNWLALAMNGELLEVYAPFQVWARGNTPRSGQ